MNEQTINIRMIQHYMYCPRRYALLEINGDWQENAFTVGSEIMHEHVHDGSHDFSDSRKTVRSAVTVYNDLPEYDLYGVVDCIEFVKAAKGVYIPTLDGKYDVRIVEYKPKAPKKTPDGAAFNETDAIHVFAQKLCADQVWGCDSEAYLYYADTKKRVRLPFDVDFAKYDERIKGLLKEMREIRESSRIPPRPARQKCSGCSIADVCFPKEPKYNVRDLVREMNEVTE